MKYGFDNGKFYIDYQSCKDGHGNMREESDRRAVELAEQGGKFMLSFSGGLDSQSVLHSFVTQDIPLETAFLYLPNYNDNEYQQVKELDKKFGVKTHIIDMDPMSVKDEVEQLAIDLDITAKNNLLQLLFLKQLPDDYNFIQIVHDPFVYVYPDYKQYGYYQGYYLPEISRERAFKHLNRTGKNIFYGDKPEFLASILDDDIFKAGITSARYYDGNGAQVPGKYLKTVDRWDYYVKPLIYAKYWGDELTYYPKYQGFENIEYLNGNDNFKKHAVIFYYDKFLEFLNTPGQLTYRMYENVPE